MTEVTEAMVNDALFARVPGGAQVKDWLPTRDASGEVPHRTAREVIMAAITAALAAQEDGVVRVPDGWQLVPKRWPDEMMEAGVEAGKKTLPDANGKFGWRQLRAAYEAALAAAPQPPASDGVSLIPTEIPDYALQKVFPLHWQFQPGQRFKQQWREAAKAINDKAAPHHTPASGEGTV